MNKTDKDTTTNNEFDKFLNDSLSQLPKIGDIIQAKVLFANKKEIMLDIESFTTAIIRGPELKNLPEEYDKIKIGDKIAGMVIDLENENGQMELSLKSAIMETAWNFIKTTHRKQTTIQTKINGANKGGLLTYIKGVQAFLPVSQLSPNHYPKVKDGNKKKILKKLKKFIGTKLSVKIINSDEENGKIIISEKRAWEEIQKEKLKAYSIGNVVEGTIKTITNFGAFLRFDDELEGLVHISEIPGSENKRAKTNELVNIDDTVKAKILNINGSKVLLSIKATEQQPAS